MSTKETTQLSAPFEGATEKVSSRERSLPSGGVSSAINMASDLKSNQQGPEDSELLLNLYRTLIEKTDLFSSLRSALKIVCRFTGWVVGMAWLPTGADNQLRLFSFWHEEDPILAEYISICQRHFFARDIGIPGRVWNRRTAEWTSNLAGEDPALFPMAKFAAPAGIKAGFGAPIIHDDHVVGVLMFCMRDFQEEDDRLVRVVSRFATQLGFALHHKRTVEDLRKQETLLRRNLDELEMMVVERTVQLRVTNEALQAEISERRRAQEEMQARVRQQEAVVYIGERGLSGASLPTLFQDACERVAETLAVELCKVLALQPDGQELTLRAGVGWKEGLVGRATVPAGTQSQAGFTLSSNRPVIVEDLSTETRFGGPSLLRDHGVVSGMSVVIPGQHGPFGVLGVHTAKRRTFHTEDVNFLESVAQLLSQAIERRVSEVAVQKSELWLRNLVATTQDAVVSIDRRGCIVLFNASAERIFGYKAEQIVGRRVNMLMAEPYSTEHDGYIARYETTGEAHAIGRIRTVTARRKSGELFPIELSVTEIGSDEEVHYAAFIRDISQKAKLQEQLVNSERLATIGATAAKIGHELGNPLNGMSLTIQLLEQRLGRQAAPMDSQVTSTISRLKREIARLNLLLLDFRALSRRDKYDLRRTNIRDVVTEALEMELAHFNELGIQVQCDFQADLGTITIDADKMKQVILNLAKNGADAMEGGGKLTIKASASASGVVLEISDTGVGISPDVDIFEPFFTTKPSGTGIGLTIVRQIVHAHGGTITYQSELGKGTNFFITIPSQ